MISCACPISSMQSCYIWTAVSDWTISSLPQTMTVRQHRPCLRHAALLVAKWSSEAGLCFSKTLYVVSNGGDTGVFTSHVTC